MIKDVTEAKPVLLQVRVWKGISEKGAALLNPRQGKDGEGRSPEHNHKQEQDEGEQRKTRQGTRVGWGGKGWGQPPWLPRHKKLVFQSERASEWSHIERLHVEDGREQEGDQRQVLAGRELIRG